MKRLVLLWAFILSSLVAFAQANEIGVLGGVIFAPRNTPSAGVGTCSISNPFCGATVHNKAAFAVEGVVAHRIFNLHVVSLHLEFPAVGAPSRGLRQGTLSQ